MKNLLILITLAFFTTEFIHAQRVSLDVKAAPMSREESGKAKEKKGGNTKNTSQSRKVVARIDSNTAGTFTVNCYWLYQKEGDKETYLKTSSEKVTVTVGKEESTEFTNTFVSSETKPKTKNSNKKNSKSNKNQKSVKSGETYKGWVITVTNSEGKILAEQGTRPPLVKEVAKMLEEGAGTEKAKKKKGRKK